MCRFSTTDDGNPIQTSRHAASEPTARIGLRCVFGSDANGVGTEPSSDFGEIAPLSRIDTIYYRGPMRKTNGTEHMMSDVHKRRTAPGGDTTIIERIPTEPDTSTTVSIVRAVAEAETVSPGELPVLADFIDPEAIDELFDSNPAVGRSGVRLSFDYCGYTVEVTDELVTLRR